MASLSVSSLALANTGNWETESVGFNLSPPNYGLDTVKFGLTNEPDCSACHDFSFLGSGDSSLGFPASRDADPDTGSLRLAPNLPIGTSSYSWRYRFDGEEKFITDNVPMDGSTSVTVPIGGATLEYCIAIQDATAIRKIRSASAMLNRVVNQDPVIADWTPSGMIPLIDRGDPFRVQLQDTDDDGPAPLSYAVTLTPASVSVSSRGAGSFDFAPEAVGGGSVRLTVTDAAGGSSFVDVPVQVVERPTENMPPSIVSPAPGDSVAMMFPGDPAVVIVSAVDSESDALFYSVSEVPASLSVSRSDNVFTFSPQSIDSGTVRLTVEDTAENVVSIDLPFSITAMTDSGRTTSITRFDPTAPRILVADGPSRVVTLFLWRLLSI